ncbi:MAG: MFS transporter [Alicyclobacillus herbarius]|uniref:MFS transporter n=1 Tax=Alicyclobacillus herbarius TaxID=122960 RepID=UPI0003FB7054|nr:MFS transporter [Alicyclobacillus herbarius]MCL6632464.1 MFS transporter [Alicyclobacillus herbarius]
MNTTVVDSDRVLRTEGTTSIRWKYIAPTLLVIWIIGMFDKIGVAVIATNKTFLADMGLLGHNALIGSLVTIMLFTYGLGFFFWGPLVDRWGPRSCAIVGLIGWAFSTFLAAVSTNFTVLMVSRGLLGLAEGFLWPVSNALTAQWFPLRERGRAKAIWINGTNIGPALAGFLVIGLMGEFHWRGVFWFLTGAALIICLPMVLFLVKNDPGEDKRVSKVELELITNQQVSLAESAGGEKKATVSTGVFWLIVVAEIANVFGVFGLMTWFPTYLENAKHVSPGAMSTYLLLGFGVALLLTIWVGSHTDKTHKKAVWLIWGFVLGAISLFLAAITGPAIGCALFLCASIAFINGITTPMIHGVIHSMSYTGSIGGNTGVMTGVGNTIGAFAPTIMGALVTVASGHYFLAFAFLIGTFLIAALVSIFPSRYGY